MGQDERMEELVVTGAVFLFVVLATSWVADKWKLSAPLLLMAVGLVGSFLPFVHVQPLQPEFVLVALLPPLLYSAAVNTPIADFRTNLPSIVALSVGLVLFTVAGVGLVTWAILGVPLAAAFALGAIVAPPDAVAAAAVARRVGLPRRLVTVLEGESLVNDATALVSLRTATLALAASVTAAGVLGDFIWAVVSGVVVGVVVARLAGLAFRLLEGAVMPTALSFLVPFAAYVPAEQLHGSGVIAVVAAGLVLGHRAQVEQGASARLFGRINWATISFVLENSVFLLIGLQAHAILADAAASEVGVWRALAATAAVLVAVIALRMVWVLGTYALIGRRKGGDLRESVASGWAGMRGVVTLAAALSLPESVPQRPVLILIALGVTLGTLVVQGTTLGWLARRLGLRRPDPREDAVEQAMILQRAGVAGLKAAEAAARPGDDEALAGLRAEQERRVNAVWERLGRPDSEFEPPAAAAKRLRWAALEGQRAEVLKIRDESKADQAVISEVLGGLDLEESMLGLASAKADAVSASPFTVRSHAEPCEHLQVAPECLRPESGECLECVAEGTAPVHLRECLTCGHVACCDSSVGRHATRHYEATGHPVMRSFEPGESWRWCYVDELISE